MSVPVRPVMTPESWEEWRAFRRLMPAEDQPGSDLTAERIAKLNDLLPESDQRKFTRVQVELLRRVARIGSSDVTRALTSLADMLESYLPPEAWSVSPASSPAPAR